MITKPRRDYPLGGWILLAIGGFLLLGQLFPQSDDLLLVLLAAGFVGAALLSHKENPTERKEQFTATPFQPLGRAT